MGKLEGSLGRELSKAQSLSVEVVTLDHFVYKLSRPAPDLIKLDIEGGEVQALEGMRRVLNMAKPVLLMELHGNQAARETAALLMSIDYELHSLDEEEAFTAPERPTEVAYALARRRGESDQKETYGRAML
jgi:chemotaxis response regulator CheB